MAWQTVKVEIDVDVADDAADDAGEGVVLDALKADLRVAQIRVAHTSVWER